MNNTYHAGQPVPDRVKEVYRPLWDTMTLAAEAMGTMKQFFTTPMSSTKGIEQTNLNKAGELAAGEAFDVYALRILLHAFQNQVDIEGVMLNFAARLYVSNVVQLEGPIEYFAAGAGVNAALDGAAAAAVCVGNGIPDPRATAQMPPDFIVQIPTGANFKVQLEGTSYTMTSTGTIRIMLEGVFTEPIE